MLLEINYFFNIYTYILISSIFIFMTECKYSFLYVYNIYNLKAILWNKKERTRLYIAELSERSNEIPTNLHL